jgi:hypothetical protein
VFDSSLSLDLVVVGSILGSLGYWLVWFGVVLVVGSRLSLGLVSMQ